MSSRIQTFLNISGALVSFLMTLGIQFFLTRYIIAKMGIAASGFYNLGMSFVSYATIISSSLNSMAGRFITLEYHQGNREKASSYYSSVWIGNYMIIALLFLPLCFFIFFLEHLISIPPDLIWDVKTLFALLFLCLFLCQTFCDNFRHTFLFQQLLLNNIVLLNLVNLVIFSLL